MLSDFAEDVVVLEPNLLTAEGNRPGAPHRRQLHALLAMGQLQLERWFPGIVEEMANDGAHLGRGSAVQFYVDGRRRPAMNDLQMIGATRPFIENSVLRRTRAVSNIRFVTGRAQGLLLHHDRVRGVRYTAGTETTATEIEADFVVDAMGRSSRLTTWLTQHGWPAAPVDRMRIDLGYATATFRRGDELPATVIVHSAPGPASNYLASACEPGALAAVEGNRWSVVVAGYHDYRPTADPDQFRARLRRCVAPLQQVANHCALEGEIDTFHFRESRRLRFTGLERFPAGLAVSGDAMASVNPIYGQGLTLATLQASCLSAHLRSGASPREPAWGYFRRTDRVVDAAWSLSTTADLAQPHVTGPYPRAYNVIRWAGDRITEASVKDPVINRAFMNVLHMRQHPRTLTRPRVLLRTARVLLDR
ncbi:hypothetical protein [Streptomyces prunicolor]|uniref:hypothetical protein n=1 Tax=Streptomyces prunicolor TaxID=67348 RepID=UPI000369C85F|nr:hypothetical protein [Streptomyces prunicolor]